MSRVMLLFILAFAAYCGDARRVARSKAQVELSTTGFGMKDAMRESATCMGLHPPKADETNMDARATCLCHAVSGQGKMGCMMMTMRARYNQVSHWACALQNRAKPDESCEPMWPSSVPRKAKPAKVKEGPAVVAEEPTVAPVAPIQVEEKVQDDSNKDDNGQMDDFDDELEDLEIELDLDDEDIADVDDKKPGDTQERTGEDEGKELENCGLIPDNGGLGERAACICELANTGGLSGEALEAKCEELGEKATTQAAPHSCAVHPTRQSCAPIQKVPDPIVVPQDPVEPVPQPTDCSENVETAIWWVAHHEYYSALFDVASKGDGKYGGPGKTLMCKFQSKSHPCLKHVHQKTEGIPAVLTLEKKKGIQISCGFDGKWQEPTNMDRQSCAYPIVPKNLERKTAGGQTIDAGEKVNRVLTVVGDKVKTIEWDGGYNLNQLFVLRPDGLVRSLAQSAKCISAINPGNWIFSKSGYLEGYLWLHECTSDAEDHVWWLGPDMGPFVRRTQNAGACGSADSCCSLTFAKTSQGYFTDIASTGKDYLTFPQIEEEVADAHLKTYIWRADGKIQERDTYRTLGWFGPLREYFRDVGVKSDGTGKVSKPSGSQVDSQLTGKFNMVVENRPKVLSWSKISLEDSMLTVLDFWKE